jgi:hypothetical protein
VANHWRRNSGDGVSKGIPLPVADGRFFDDTALIGYAA